MKVYFSTERALLFWAWNEVRDCSWRSYFHKESKAKPSQCSGRIPPSVVLSPKGSEKSQKGPLPKKSSKLMFLVQQKELLKCCKSITAGSEMPASHHADQYWGRCAASETAWPPGVFVARSAASKNSFEMSSWYSRKPGESWAQKHLFTSWHFAVSLSSTTQLYLLFLISKKLWAISVLCFSNGKTWAANECDSSILQLHHKSWIIITSRMWVSVTAAAQWAFLSYFFFIPPWT